MATSNSNNLVNPNAREAMNRFKMEAAAEDAVSILKSVSPLEAKISLFVFP